MTQLQKIGSIGSASIASNRSSEKPLEIEDYGHYLRELNITFSKAGFYYYRVGPIARLRGWIFNISVIKNETFKIMEVLVPFLIENNLTFKIPKNVEIAHSIQQGNLGLEFIGKIISIQVPPNSDIIALLTQLIVFTNQFHGPENYTDRHLASIVYTRLGAIDPIIKINEKGLPEEYIYGDDGNLIRDIYKIPFELSKGVPWPFGKIAIERPPKKNTILQDKYKPIKVIKEDVKGYVKKALWLQKNYLIKWCIIKEGKKWMIVDDFGRDIRDRIKWQFKLHSQLQSYLPIPKPYSLFEENENYYFIMQYIDGHSLDDYITKTFNGRIWVDLSFEDQEKILSYFLNILQIIEDLHKAGYIHRDITPVNFLLDKNENLWLIDLELAYCKVSENLLPPFELGTSGFMSPEQQNKEQPTEYQDIYALGALLMTMLTSQLPAKFTTIDKNILEKQLSFFIPTASLVKLISECLHDVPFSRPKIKIIKEVIEKYKTEKRTNPGQKQTSIISNHPDKSELEIAIKETIQGLSSEDYMIKNGVWLSSSKKINDPTYLQSTSGSINIGFFEGLSGILYTLSCANELGFSIAACHYNYKESIRHIIKEISSNQNSISSGLYGGSSGIVLALIKGHESGLLSDSKEIIIKMAKNLLLNENHYGLSICEGLAGYGIALLKSAPYLDDSTIRPLIDKTVKSLVINQERDGSWTTLSRTSKNRIKQTGFSSGVAGIVTFLLCYSKKYGSTDDIQLSIIKALNWLKKEAKTSNGNVFWSLGNNTKILSRHFLDGIAGIILCFIKAYDYLGDPNYRLIAERALSSYPDTWNCRDISFGSGNVGLYEVYMEAAMIFNSQEWLKKADCGLEFILNIYKKNQNNTRLWLVDITPNPAAGFMVGNSGILHYLLRCYNPSRVTHPFLPI